MNDGGPNDSASRIREVFLRARALSSGSERDAYLDQACSLDPGMRAKVERLLGRESASEIFLEGNTAEQYLGVSEDLIGTVIGRYRIIERLGEGGFGEVFRVEQTEPIHRQLALKIIKPGMDSREVIARFEGERQALALMEHPNIAQVHDAGTTDTGRPYFVMELVVGQPITVFCDSRELPISSRLDLFLKVCAAVQHAHQRGIIHRDLKPSNIVITVDLGTDTAIPKIIDFGIAKSLQGRLTDRTMITQREVLLGTPAYMSPEQLELSSDTLDTRTDIYALGVLLYEMLAGVQPFERETLKRAAFAEVRRIIREVEPLKPSDRVHSLGDTADTVAKTRLIAPPTLERTLRGDLDWIVMKAIEKDRDRRYQGAGDLARDIVSYLEHEPVSAGPPDRIYRLQKFVRRHRMGVAFSGVVVIAVVTGFILMSIGFSRASRERDRARLAELVTESESVRVKAVQSLYEPYRWHAPNTQREFLFLGPDENLVPSSRALQESMNALAARLEENLPGLEAVESELRKTLADSYLCLELTADAVVQLDRLIEIARERYGVDHIRYADSLIDKAVALNPGFRGVVEFSHGYSQGVSTPPWQVEEAARLGQEALAIYRSHDHVSPYVIDAIRFAGQGDTENWEAICLEIVETSKRLYGEDSIQTLESLQDLGYCLAWKGRFDEARPLIEQYQEALRAQDDGPYTIIHSAVPKIGNLYTRHNQVAEAERIYRDEISRLEGKVRGEFNSTYGAALGRLNILLDAQGRPDPEVKAKLARIALWTALDPALCRVDYRLQIQKPGAYRLYLRWDGFDRASNNISARMRELQDGEGGEIADLYGFVVPDIPGDADFSTLSPWQHQANFEHDERWLVDSYSAEWVIPAPGTYTLQLIGTKTGAAVDAFILQHTELPHPTGQGADRTPQNPDGSYTEVDGRIAVEAEDFSSRIPGRITDWLAVPEESEAVVDFSHATGKGYLQVLPERDLIEPASLIRNRALAAEKSGDFVRAIELYDEMVDQAPSFSSYEYRGSAYERLGDYERALEDFQKSIDLNFPMFRAWPQYWDCHLRLGMNDALIERVTPYVEVEGGLDFLKMKLARARVNIGLWREAIEGIRPQGPGDILWIMRGDLYADHEEYTNAEKEFLMAVQMSRNSLRPYPKLTALYLLRGDRKAYQACLKDMPPPKANRLNQNRMYLWQSILASDTCPDNEIFEKTLARVLDWFDAVSPEDRLIRAELAGAALYRCGQFEPAVGLLTEAQEIDADPWGTYRSRWMFFLAMALHGQGREEEARNWFDRAEATLVEERVSVPANQDLAYPTPWDNTVTVEILRREAAGVLGNLLKSEQTAMFQR